MSLNQFRNREERARFERGEAAELEHKLAPVKAELSKTLKRADAAARIFFSQPLRHLADLINSEMFEADHGVIFPRTDERQNGTRGRAEYTEFVANLPKSGFLLSSAGAQRLLLYVLAQAYSENHADMQNPDTWRIAFDRLYQLGCFDEARAEIGYDESLRVVEPVVEQPAPELGMNDLEEIDTSTRTGAALAHDIISRAVFEGEARGIFQEWLWSLFNNFGYVMTPEVQREVIDFFRKNNWSFLSRKAYDDARLNLCRRGVMPQTCLTEEDILAGSIESEYTQSCEGRRRLKEELLAARRR